MLNRRYLRIKVMQSLYGFEIAKRANFHLSLDIITENFTPDWIEKKDADYEALKVGKEKALELFKQYYPKPSYLPDAEDRVRRACLEAMNFYHNQRSRDKNFFSKNLLQQVDAIYELYLLSLLLIVELAELTAEDEDRFHKRNLREEVPRPVFAMARNRIAQRLKNNEFLEAEAIRRGLNWNTYRSTLQELYRNVLKQDKTYLDYARKSETSPEEDMELVNYLIKKIIFRKKTVNYFQASNITLEIEGLNTYFSTAKPEAKLQEIIDLVPQAVSTFFENYSVPSANIDQLSQRIGQQITKSFRQGEGEPSTLDKFDNSPDSISEEAAEASKFLSKEYHSIGEKLVYLTLSELIAGISDYLKESDTNHVDNQGRIIQALNESLNIVLEHITPSWNEKGKVLLKIQSERLNNIIGQFFKEYDLHWAEDQRVVQSMVQTTIKNLASTPDHTFELAPLSKNWEEDKLFYLDLYKKNIENEERYEEIIAEKSRNWELSRLALIDKVILKMAICEMIHFYSIPVKVSINEYIELSKVYSTQKSRQYINGLLDAISQELIEKRIIKKSGRGLMDNK